MSRLGISGRVVPILLLVLATISFVGMPSALAQASTVTTNTKVPVTIFVFIPCANELIVVSGNLHILSHVTIDSNGGGHIQSHFQPQGVSGTGLTSGDKYQGVGVTRQSANFRGPAPVEFTFVNRFQMIGQGPGNNLLVHQTIHMTVNANGVITANVSNFSVVCK